MKDDLISRHAEIDAARAELDGGTPYDIPEKIERLPAAEPVEIIRCKDCYPTPIFFEPMEEGEQMIELKHCPNNRCYMPCMKWECSSYHEECGIAWCCRNWEFRLKLNRGT